MDVCERERWGVSGRGRHRGERVRDRESEWWVIRGLKGLGGVRVVLGPSMAKTTQQQPKTRVHQQPKLTMKTMPTLHSLKTRAEAYLPA